MDLLVQKILEKEPAAMLMAQEMGSSATAAVKPLVNHEDADIRQFAVRCLNRSGGYGVTDVFVNALSDESPSVRAAALNALENHLDAETYPQLLQAYEKIPDSQHRQEIVLMLARTRGANFKDLKQLCENEQNPEALEGCLVALAKLGEPNSQAEFLNQLKNSRGHQLKRFLEYVEYLGQIWALRGLTSVLNDKMPLLGGTFCRAPEGYPEAFRACDLAVNLIAKIAGTKFSFPVDKIKNYSGAELAEARRFLENLP